MTKLEILAQAIGIFAMGLNIISFQFKKQKALIFVQLLVSALFSVNMLLLGGIMGAILNIINVIRAIVFYFKDKLRSDSPAWLVAFVTLYVSAYILNFAVFAKAPTLFDYIIELLPVIGTIALTVGFGLRDSAQTRKCALINSPSWLVYNLFIGTWGGIICEVLTTISIMLAMFRHDRVKDKGN